MEKAAGLRSNAAMNAAIAGERMQLDKSWGVPQRYSVVMREIWMLQPLFEIRRGARPFRLLGQQRFRAAFDFMCLRAQMGEIDAELVSWWQNFQHASEDERTQMIRSAPDQESRTTRSRPRRRRRRVNTSRQETA